MKKTFLFFAMALIASSTLLAQEGEIIYTDYGPEGWSYEFDRMGPDGFDTLQIDLDRDGVADVFYRGWGWYAPAPEMPDMELRSRLIENQQACFGFKKQNDGNGGTLFFDIYGDTIPGLSTWYKLYTVRHGYFENPERPNARYIAIRLPQENGGYCYGWLEQSIEWIMYPEPPGYYFQYYYNGLVRVYRWAFCTIPDYPMRVGQTDFTWDVMEENQTTAFATLYPNPATGLVTVMGKDLKAAEVVNMLGQRVITVQGEGETMQIDISNLPTGIYFVNITDTEGRKYVRKVVKE
jgi:hypothetical protein